MKKLLVVLILAGAGAAGIAGFNVAYERTKALGFGDQNPPFAIVTENDGSKKIRIYDYVIDLGNF